MRVLLVMILLSLCLAAFAMPQGSGVITLAAVEGQQVRIGSGQAATLVKQRYQGSKILSINLIASKGPPVYRVKMLSPSGVVKYVFVDGTTGSVFE